MDGTKQERGALSWSNGPLSLAPFAFFDLETTGLRPDRGARVTEIAVVGDDRPLLRWRRDAVEEAPFEDQLPLLLECLAGSVVVGHNLRFDFKFVAYEARRHGLEGLCLRYVDTLALARELLNRTSDVRLGTLLSYFDLSPEGELHTALVDARATRTLFWRLVDEGNLRTLADAGVKPLTWNSP